MFNAADFYTPTRYNCQTKDQLWMSIIADSHDVHCQCDTPFAHLLANIFPPGHKDRDLTINDILKRDYQQLRCHSGGGGAENSGGAGEGPSTKEQLREGGGEYVTDKDLEDLIAAGEDAVNTR